MDIRTPQPLSKGPAFAHRRGLRDRTGPSKRSRPPIRRATNLAAAKLRGLARRAPGTRKKPTASPDFCVESGILEHPSIETQWLRVGLRG